MSDFGPEVGIQFRETASGNVLKLGTGHPQGGNAMSNDPRIALIDDQFRLRGFSNLRICDGSIFPENAGVNPQWTMMALAHECARVSA
jgi:choline dehydrogenase